jgi:hypothetical protein
MRAEFANVPSAAVETVTETLPELDGPLVRSVGSDQVTVPPANVPPPVALTNEVPAGSASVSDTLVAALAPVFEYAIVYVNVDAAVAAGADLVSAMAGWPSAAVIGA